MTDLGSEATDVAVPAAELDLDTTGLSYEEYFDKINELRTDLKTHWKSEQRVRALKVIIQMSKLLSDTSQLKLYSKKFRLVTDSLDEFGVILHERITSKANANSSTSTANTSPPKYSSYDQAKEICRNWFLKVASIRELTPRFYIELAILEISEILLKPSTFGIQEEQFYAQSLRRHVKFAWGFGDPIVAIHARAYITRITDRLISVGDYDNIAYEILTDNLTAGAELIARIDIDAIRRMVNYQRVSLSLYFELLTNGLITLISTILTRYDIDVDCDKLDDETMQKLDKIADTILYALNRGGVSVLSRNIMTNSLLRGMPTVLLRAKSDELFAILEDNHQMLTSGINQSLSVAGLTRTSYFVLESLAISFVGTESLIDALADSAGERRFMSDRFEYMLEDLLKRDGMDVSAQYIRTFKAWLAYLGSSGMDMRKPLEIILRHLKANRNFVSQQTELVELIKISMADQRDLSQFKALFKLGAFSELLGMIRKDSLRLEAARLALETLRPRLNSNHGDNVKIEDSTTINMILKFISMINDSLGLLIAADDVNYLSKLTIYFLNAIDYGECKDGLDFLSRCRTFVSNLNPTLEYLARRALDLADEFKKTEQKKRAKFNFISGCLAYTLVTIPALQGPSLQMEVCLEGLKTALCNTCIALADYYVKRAIDTLEALIPHPELKFETQAHELLDIMVRFEDHIDLRHKLLLSDMIRSHCKPDSGPIEKLKLLNLVAGD